MGESKVHMDLVQVALRYIRARVPDRNAACIYVDTPETEMAPSVLGGYHPDVYFKDGSTLIIGEAKTERDLSRPHSVNQLRAYYAECQAYEGDAVLVVAVPWMVARKTQNFFRLLRSRSRDAEVCVVVLDERGGVFNI